MVERHGGASHFMRPDRVYRTGVLAPMVGYRPGPDVVSVTQAFVDGGRGRAMAFYRGQNARGRAGETAQSASLRN